MAEGRHSAPQVLAEGGDDRRVIHALLEEDGVVYGGVEARNVEVSIRDMQRCPAEQRGKGRKSFIDTLIPQYYVS